MSAIQVQVTEEESKDTNSTSTQEFPNRTGHYRHPTSGVVHYIVDEQKTDADGTRQHYWSCIDTDPDDSEDNTNKSVQAAQSDEGVNFVPVVGFQIGNHDDDDRGGDLQQQMVQGLHSDQEDFSMTNSIVEEVDFLEVDPQDIGGMDRPSSSAIIGEKQNKQKGGGDVVNIPLQHNNNHVVVVADKEQDTILLEHRSRVEGFAPTPRVFKNIIHKLSKQTRRLC